MNLVPITLGTSSWVLSEATLERLGWVLVQSLWQFTLIAIVTLVVLRLLRRSSASFRYAILVFTMAACVVLPVATWFSLPIDLVAVATDVRKDAVAPLPMESMPSPLRSSDEIASVSDEQGVIAELPAISNQPSIERSRSATESSDWWMNASESLRPWLISIVTAWILGVMICAMRPLLGWIAIRRWRRVGTVPVSQDVTELMLRLSDRLAVGRTVEILQSSLVHVPLVFGCLRPLILLPASLLANLPTSQLEAIIAHELAHVRRHDYLVNVLQTIIETLFFYHPAIWWLSHCIRIERENCCDDLVVSVLCNRVDYGRALLAVEEDQGFASTLAVGARGGSLLARVQRLAGLEAARRRPVAGVAALVTSGLLVAGTAVMIGGLLLAAGDDNGSLFGKESNGLQIRLIPLSSDVSDESPELQKLASSFKRSQQMTFAVQLKNVSREPISLAGIRYGDGYAPETKGKLNTTMLGPHWFEFEFTGMDGKRILRTSHREFYQGWHNADHASVHGLAPGESLIEVLRPAKFMEPMNYDLLPGKYRVQVHYRGPNASLRENVRKHWPSKPILNAWPHHATSNSSDFAIEEASGRTKPEELIWGKPIAGLQAALEYRLPDDAKGDPLVAPGVAVGTHLGITFHLRNVSDKPITFVSETGRQGDYVHVTDESGKQVEVENVFFTGWPIDVAWKLMPGEVAQLNLLTPGLGSLDKPGKYKVRYTIRFNSRIQKDEAGNIIFPRPGDYDKEVDTGETPLFFHEPKNDVSANGEIQPDGPSLDGASRDEVNQPATATIASDSTANTRTVANRGTLRGRFVFDGVPPPSKDYFGDQETIDGSKPQQPGPDGRMSGVEALYREFLAKGARPETKDQTLLVGNDSGVANIYVWASSKNIPWAAPAEGLAPVNVELRDGKLTNRCIKVVAGQQIQLVNRDPVDHALAADFMKARNSSFNFLVNSQSRYERELSFPVAEPFPTRLGLGRTPWASGVLFVHSNPYVAITQSDGSFEIANLPIGEWEFTVWHETAGYLLPNKGVFKHNIVEGENSLGTKLLKPEAFGIRDDAKAVAVKPENREQIGTVQGKPVYRDEIANGNLLELFTKPIWTKYKAEHRAAIEPTEKELELARSYFSQQHRVQLEKEGGESKLREQLKSKEDKLANSKLSEEETNKLELEHSGLRARLRPIDPGFANFILDNWKLQKHLYENFGGGRILWQQAGQEAFDAMRTWLELQEKNGEFQITDPKLRAQFYQYWNQDHGAFLTSDEQRIREEFLQPPWSH